MKINILISIIKNYKIITLILILGWVVYGLSSLELSENVFQAGGREVNFSDLENYKCRTKKNKGFFVALLTAKYHDRSYYAQVGDTKCSELEKSFKIANKIVFMLSDTELFEILVDNRLILSYEEIKKLKNMTVLVVHFLPLFMYLLLIFRKYHKVKSGKQKIEDLTFWN